MRAEPATRPLEPPRYTVEVRHKPDRWVVWDAQLKEMVCVSRTAKLAHRVADALNRV